MRSIKTPLLHCLAMLLLALPLTAQEETFVVVEQMPEFPGCEEISDRQARKDCALNKLLTYIGDHIEYPEAAKAAGLEGLVVVSFVVEKDGSLSDIKTIRDIGQGCGDAATAVIHKMNTDGLRWNTGKQRGTPVRVIFKLPVRFSLTAPAPTNISNRDGAPAIEEEVVMEVPPPPPPPAPAAPRVKAPPPPPPPPPMIEEEPVFFSEDVLDVPSPPSPPAPPREAAPPPPPPPPPPTEEIIRIVEEMPRFPSPECEAKTTESEKKQCAEEHLLQYIYKNLNYPAVAKENGVEGMVVVSFTVDSDGTLSNIRAVRDIGAGCGDEAVRVIQQMNTEGLRWIPGRQAGKTVPVQFNMPFRFKLPEDKIERPIEDLQEDMMEYDEEINIPPPPPPPSMPPPVCKEIFKVVEEMPRFPGCEDESNLALRKECAQAKMLEYIYQNINYPPAAKGDGIEGMVVVSFVVEKDGTLSDTNILRAIGGGCDEEIVRVINLMNEENIRWIPGKQRGRTVRVQYNLPVKFRL